jgi:thiol:disulfide interchange protein
LLVELLQRGIAPVMECFFSLALALPIYAFAMFPGWLTFRCNWLNTVKVVLGFLELALFQIQMPIWYYNYIC